jgi:hypothetical protein
MYIGLRLLSTGHVSISLHPHCTPRPFPCIYKRKGQGPHTGGWSRGTLSLSLADACNPYCKRIHSGAGQHEAAVFPPLCSVSRQPIWAGACSDNLLVGPGTPGVETPTAGALGRGLLRVDEQLPVKFQMGSLQQPLQPWTLLRFGSLEFMSLDGSYDMALLPPQRDSDNDGRQPARRRRTRRRLPSMAEEQHPGLSRRLPRRRRRRRGNRGQAGGGTSLAVERVDDIGATAGDILGVDLAPKTMTSVVSPQHANPKRTDDASALTMGLLGVTRLRHRSSIKRYRPFSTLCPSDSALIHQATPLR